MKRRGFLKGLLGAAPVAAVGASAYAKSNQDGNGFWTTDANDGVMVKRDMQSVRALAESIFVPMAWDGMDPQRAWLGGPLFVEWRFNGPEHEAADKMVEALTKIADGPMGLGAHLIWRLPPCQSQLGHFRCRLAIIAYPLGMPQQLATGQTSIDSDSVPT